MGALRLYCLSSHPNKPCFVLKWPDVTIMLDCGLDLRALLQFVPVPIVDSIRLKNLTQFRSADQEKVFEQLKDCYNQTFVDGAIEVCPPEPDLIDFSTVDAIVISNYNSMLALPFVTEKTHFNGIIYATEPTIQFGRLLMEELVEYVSRSGKRSADPSWKSADIYRQFILASDMNPNQWSAMYSSDDLSSCLTRIKPIALSETLDVCGQLTLSATSSGICIGGCNWVIRTDYEKIVYMGSSSALMAHPKVLNTDALKSADVMILSSLTQAPHQHPDAMLGEFCTAVVNTVRNGGNVLVPCYPTGLLYDLLEFICQQLDNNGFSLVPIYVVSHVADSALAFANIYAEWLADPKQSKVFLPEEPFPHGQMVKNGRIKLYSSVKSGLSKDFRCPCVVFASHPSLRLGDAVHFMELWANHNKNTVILAEPDFCVPEVLAPYQPLAMRAVFCPIDTSVNFGQLKGILRELRPRTLYIPDKYRKPPYEFASYPEYCVQYETPPIAFRKNQVLAIPFYKKFLKIKVDQELASNVNFKKINGVNVSWLSGVLSFCGNRLVLEPADETSIEKATPFPYGTLDLSTLLSNLKKNGFSPIEECPTKGRKYIRLEKEKITIDCQDTNTTHVICDEIDESNRRKVTQVLLQSLSTF